MTALTYSLFYLLGVSVCILIGLVVLYLDDRLRAAAQCNAYAPDRSARDE